MDETKITEIVDEVIESLCSTIAGATEEDAREIEKFIDSYANDYVLSNHKDITEKELNEIVKRVVDEYNSLD